MKRVNHISLVILLFLSLTTIGQTNVLENSWGLDKDIAQVKQNDTLQFFTPNPFLYKTYKFGKNGDLSVCGETKPVKAKGRTVECIWTKIGTWSYQTDTLQIKSSNSILIFKSALISKDHCKFVLNKIWYK